MVTIRVEKQRVEYGEEIELPNVEALIAVENVRHDGCTIVYVEADHEPNVDGDPSPG